MEQRSVRVDFIPFNNPSNARNGLLRYYQTYIARNQQSVQYRRTSTRLGRQTTYHRGRCCDDG